MVNFSRTKPRTIYPEPSVFSREYDFPKTFSLTENQFSGKTYFYATHPWVLPVESVVAAAQPPHLGVRLAGHAVPGGIVLLAYRVAKCYLRVAKC